jgi:hypothetical protein
MTRKNRPHPIEVQHQVELPQQVIAGNVILKPKRMEKLLLRALTSHHAGPLRCCYNGITRTLPIQEFSKRSTLRVFNEATLAATSFSTASKVIATIHHLRESPYFSLHKGIEIGFVKAIGFRNKLKRTIFYFWCGDPRY